MCTGNDVFTEEQFLSLGAIGYLKKPHGFSTLKAKIRDLFKGRE